MISSIKINVMKTNSALRKGKVFDSGCIKLQSFGVIYYTAIDNKNNEKSSFLCFSRCNTENRRGRDGVD